MDTRSSFLIVGLYLAIALVLSAIVASVFYVRGNRLEAQLAQEAAEAADQSRQRDSYLRRNAISRQEFMEAASAAEVDRLRALLKEKTELLEQRTTDLKQRTAAYQKLQQEFDAATTVLLQTLAARDKKQETRAAPAEPASENAATAGEISADPEPGSDNAAAMAEEITRVQMLENALSEEVAQLQAEVLAAEVELARIQDEARRQTERLLDEERLLREVASETLVRIGEPAIPVLVDFLRDENARVRRWAALMLADLGPAAPAAVGPLMEALGDRDESVRAAAAQALRAVSEKD